MKAVKFFSIAAIAMAAAVTTSCGNDDEAVNNNVDGILSFAAQVNNGPQGRATSANTFENGDEVSIAIAKVTSTDPGTGGTYTFTADGNATATFTPATALYWNDYPGGIDVHAWYPKETSYSYPTDQSGGIQGADFLFASQTGINKSNGDGGTKNLLFKHKTAKVSVTLTAGSGFLSSDMTGAAVRFFGNTVVNSIDYKTGAITANTVGEITPSGLTALLLPTTLTAGSNVIKITIDGKDYYYKNSYTFEAEKSYTFGITVNKTGLEVQGSIDNWTSGGSTTVTVE